MSAPLMREPRFIAVIHRFFVGSEGFEVMSLTARDAATANDQAAAICFQKQSTFRHYAYHVIELGPDEFVAPNRSLSFIERLIGRTL